MKILTFCAYYTPEIAASMYLTTNLFEDLTQNGIDIEVFAPSPSRGVDKDTIKKYRKIKKETLCEGHLVIHRFSMIHEGKSIVGRAVRYILICLKFIMCGLKTKADIMFIDSTPPTQGPMAAFLKKVKKIPYVYNLQDVFPDSLIHSGICTEKSIFYKIGLIIEKITYKNSDRIITISDDFKQMLIDKGVSDEKISVVYNWVDENAVRFIPREKNDLFDKYNLDRSKFYVAYSGNIGLTQNIDMLLEIAEELKNEENIAYILVGNGAYKESAEKIISDKNLTNVYLLPFQPYEKISEVFSLGDVGLIISKKNIGSNSVPSKTWSYMSAERPILASFDLCSDLCRIIERAGCGICVDAGCKEALKEAIIKMAYEKNTEYSQNSRKYILENLTRSIGTKLYGEIICQCFEDFGGKLH